LLGVAALAGALGIAFGAARAPEARASRPAAPARQPTAVPAVLIGDLKPRRAGGCDDSNDGLLEACSNGLVYWVRYGGRDLSRFHFQKVKIEGPVGQCGLDRYVHVSSIEPSQGCAATPPSRKVNLAKGKPVYANSTDLPGMEARRANDDDPLTFWFAPGESAWLYVDLGQPTTVNEARLMWAAPHASQYGIFVWDDTLSAPAWVRVFRKDGGTQDETVAFAPAFARYVMIYLTRSSDATGGFALREWQLFGGSTPNQSLGAQRIDASSVGADAPLAADGDKGTGWQSVPKDDAETDGRTWWRVWFTSRTKLSEIRVSWANRTLMPGAYWGGFYQGREVKDWTSRLVSRNLDQRLSWPGCIEADAFIIMVDGWTTRQSSPVKLMEVELYGPGEVPGEPPRTCDARIGPNALPLAQLLRAGAVSGVEVDLSAAPPGGEIRSDGTGD